MRGPSYLSRRGTFEILAVGGDDFIARRGSRVGLLLHATRRANVRPAAYLLCDQDGLGSASERIGLVRV